MVDGYQRWILTQESIVLTWFGERIEDDVFVFPAAALTRSPFAMFHRHRDRAKLCLQHHHTYLSLYNQIIKRLLL